MNEQSILHLLPWLEKLFPACLVSLVGYSLRQWQSITKKKYEDPVSLQFLKRVIPICQLKSFKRSRLIVSLPGMAEGSP